MIDLLSMGVIYFLGFGILVAYMMHKEFNSKKYTRNADFESYMKQRE